MNSANAYSIDAAAVPATGGNDIMFGRFMMPDMTEHACQVASLSIDGATFITSHVPIGGQQIVAYLDVVGRVEAVSADAVPGGFRVLFPPAGPKRERLAARLAWLANKDQATEAEQRRHARHEPKDTSSHITLPDGRVYPCEVIDISVSGAGVKVDVMPSLGTFVMLGKMRGRIVRYLDTGIAIEFVRPLERGQLTEHIRRD